MLTKISSFKLYSLNELKKFASVLKTCNTNQRFWWRDLKQCWLQMASQLSLVNKCNKFKLKIQLSQEVETKSKSLIQRTNRWVTVVLEKWKTRSIDHRKTWLAETLTEKLFIQLSLITHFRFTIWEWLTIKDHSIILKRTSSQ